MWKSGGSSSLILKYNTLKDKLKRDVGISGNIGKKQFRWTFLLLCGIFSVIQFVFKSAVTYYYYVPGLLLNRTNDSSLKYKYVFVLSRMNM